MTLCFKLEPRLSDHWNRTPQLFSCYSSHVLRYPTPMMCRLKKICLAHDEAKRGKTGKKKDFFLKKSTFYPKNCHRRNLSPGLPDTLSEQLTSSLVFLQKKRPWPPKKLKNQHLRLFLTWNRRFAETDRSQVKPTGLERNDWQWRLRQGCDSLRARG